MITLTDPTLAGTKDPAKKRIKLQERIQHLESEKERMDDQIYCMECEITRLA